MEHSASTRVSRQLLVLAPADATMEAVPGGTWVRLTWNLPPLFAVPALESSGERAGVIAHEVQLRAARLSENSVAPPPTQFMKLGAAVTALVAAEFLNDPEQVTDYGSPRAGVEALVRIVGECGTGTHPTLDVLRFRKM